MIVTTAREKIAVVGWMPPPHNGRSHEVGMIAGLPLGPRFDIVPYDTKLRTPGGRRTLAIALRGAAAHAIGFPRFLATERPDAVVFCTGPGAAFWHDLALLRRCHKAGVPVVVRFLGGSITQALLLGRARRGRAIAIALEILGRARMFLAETHAMVDDLRALFPAVPAERVPNFLEAGALPVVGGRPHHDDGPPGVVYLGNMTPTKGVETLLACVDPVCDARPGATFHFVGGELEPGYLGRFRARARALRHAGSVRVHGRLPRPEALAVARACRVFGFPTRWPGEGQPAALVEAMGMGLVPVAARWRGVAEVVVDGVNGVLVDGDDPAAYAREIIPLLGDARRLDALSRSARASILEGYDVPRAAELYRQVLRRCLAGDGRDG